MNFIGHSEQPDIMNTEQKVHSFGTIKRSFEYKTEERKTELEVVLVAKAIVYMKGESKTEIYARVRKQLAFIPLRLSCSVTYNEPSHINN